VTNQNQTPEQKRYQDELDAAAAKWQGRIGDRTWRRQDYLAYDREAAGLKPTTCTVGPDAVHGKRCGKPAVKVVKLAGMWVAECAEHAAPRSIAAPAVGDVVPVHRWTGKTYRGVVTRITRSGKVFARITYDNGSTKEVEV